MVNKQNRVGARTMFRHNEVQKIKIKHKKEGNKYPRKHLQLITKLI